MSEVYEKHVINQLPVFIKEEVVHNQYQFNANLATEKVTLQQRYY